MCEEFGCLPSQAVAEINRQPPGELERLIQMRSFAAIWRAVKSATTKEADTLALDKGVVRWSVDRPRDEDWIDDLDYGAMQTIVEAILRFTNPAIFQTDAEAEAESKNGSGVSPAISTEAAPVPASGG